MTDHKQVMQAALEALEDGSPHKAKGVLLAALQAALAEPPEPDRIYINYSQATQLLEMFGGEESDITLQFGPGHSGDGLYAFHTEQPQEGSILLDPNEPTPARTEVGPVAWLDPTNDNKVLTARQKVDAETHLGAPGKILAAAYTIPLYVHQPHTEPCRVNPAYSGPSNCNLGTVGCTVPAHRTRTEPVAWWRYSLDDYSDADVQLGPTEPSYGQGWQPLYALPRTEPVALTDEQIDAVDDPTVLTDKQINDIWDAYQDAPHFSFRYLVTNAVIAAAVPPGHVVVRVEGAAKDVLAERKRQIETEGWTAAHDDSHSDGSLALAAACYASNAATWAENGTQQLRDKYAVLSSLSFRWPWLREWWKPTSQRRDIVKAAALLLAEIERLDRQAISAAARPKP